MSSSLPPTCAGNDLAARFPKSINDQPVHVRNWAGPDWVARFDLTTPGGVDANEAVNTLLWAADADLDDLSVAAATVEYRPGNFAAISAFRIPGARMTELHGVRHRPVELDAVETGGRHECL